MSDAPEAQTYAEPPGAGRYVGRFAPSPTGPLHAGSLVAALASWLDARAHDGRWLVRMEDVDAPRCVPGADRVILEQLAALGLESDAPVMVQSQRVPVYRAAFERLQALGRVFPCGCTRREIADSLERAGHAHARHGELVYPGTCRDGLHGKPARAWRLRVPDADAGDALIEWSDRRLGPQRQNLAEAVGDFVLLRADGLWAYQLAVVVDDADQGVTHVVRGEDLIDSTARQIYLQRCLGMPTPAYLHVPLVLGADSDKLSKQNGAVPIDLGDLGDPLQPLRAAGGHLGLDVRGRSVAEWLEAATAQWRARWGK